jgi:hypothetical protein
MITTIPKAQAAQPRRIEIETDAVRAATPAEANNQN